MACSKSSPQINDEDNPLPTEKTVTFYPKTTGLIKNPMMGWGIYSDLSDYTDNYAGDMQFWTKFDALNIDRYATHLYIRWPWSAYEGAKGQYAWDTNPFFKLLVEGAKQRGLKLAFRVYVDSRDYATSSTPQYVRDAGAQGYGTPWSPYADDTIFQAHYTDFITAFADEFDDSDVVDYVDGFGLGKWGEGHSMILRNDYNYETVFKWIVDLYHQQFKHVLLALNYHVEIGAPLLNYAFNEKDFILRHDAFGMSEWYGNFEKGMVAAHFPNRPIITESGWWMNGNTAWMNDPRGYNAWRNVWEGTLGDALLQQANTLDLRSLNEATSWIQTSPDLVQRFIADGGYRLYPSEVKYMETIGIGEDFTISHTWNNMGIGVCPNNLKQWNYKYKVAFALLDTQTKEIRTLLIDDEAEPSQWLRGQPKSYKHRGRLNGVKAGKYRLAVAVVDTSKDNKPALNLAMSGNVTQEGWWEVGDVTVQ
ncbi:DUF4832 domain-containing protein [Sphingobacterium sp. Ka21]|uniref:DUF4832 domain-containing protein n=2 Tax=Sphingobacterium pedocola TaxID=2082722 RepID=A0ABR9T8C2_9SPHI|nr:DUF4832 domain-containing protein [Sphingobacterium pedocola]